MLCLFRSQLLSCDIKILQIFNTPVQILCIFKEKVEIPTNFDTLEQSNDWSPPYKSLWSMDFLLHPVPNLFDRSHGIILMKNWPFPSEKQPLQQQHFPVDNCSTERLSISYLLNFISFISGRKTSKQTRFLTWSCWVCLINYDNLNLVYAKLCKPI